MPPAERGVTDAVDQEHAGTVTGVYVPDPEAIHLDPPDGPEVLPPDALLALFCGHSIAFNDGWPQIRVPPTPKQPQLDGE